MADRKAGLEGRKLSRALAQAISADETIRFMDLPVLAEGDVADLKRVLRGERDPGIPVDKKRAVNALAHSESSDEATDILARILSDPQEPARVRALAAGNLSLMPPEAAERALLESLTVEDEIIRVEVFKALGSVGTARALARSKELPDPKTEHVRRQLSLARAAIAFRSGLEAEGREATSALGIRWTTHAARALEGERAREVVDTLRDSTYGIALSPDTGFEISCGPRASHFLLLNREVERSALIESVRSRKMIAGLVALAEAETRHATVRYLVLTSPSESGVEVIVARTDGTVAYLGEARPDGDGFQLTMRDVGLERTPTEIQGRVSNEGLQLSLRVWRGQNKPKKHGKPVLG